MADEQWYKHLDEVAESRDDWARRRRKNIPTDKRLMVVACMDERIPVQEALDIELGDAHVFRNAGGKVTDDVIRSAALSTNLFGTEEIIVINHTDCGMLSAPADTVVEALEEASGQDLRRTALNPALEELNLGEASVEEWLYMSEDIDEACQQQVALLEKHPLIPDSVSIHGYVYEVESRALRKPGTRIGERISQRTEP